MPNQLQQTKPQQFQNFVIFKIDNAKVNIDLLFQNETLWLIQKQVAELFEVNVLAVFKYFKNIFEIRELEESAVSSKMETTCKEFLQVQRKL